MHPVVELIKERKRAGSLPGQRTDGFKLGLAIEGGGMRGLVTSGMGTALEQLGLLRVFDVVYGTSAGAFNGAYFVAGQANYGGTIYYQEINNRRFIDLRRLLIPGKAVMNLEYLVWEVARNRKVLDCQAIIDSKIPLVILVSSLRESRARRLRDFRHADNVLRALLATARMPGLAGGPVDIDGEPYFDGGLFEAIPFHSAVDEECTHVLTLLSRPRGRTSLNTGFFQRLVENQLLRQYPAAQEATDRRRETYPRDVAFLSRKTAEQDGPPFIYAVQPPAGTQEIGRLERSRNALLAGAACGFSEVWRLFSETDAHIVELLAAFSPTGERLRGADVRA